MESEALKNIKEFKSTCLKIFDNLNIVTEENFNELIPGIQNDIKSLQNLFISIDLELEKSIFGQKLAEIYFWDKKIRDKFDNMIEKKRLDLSQIEKELKIINCNKNLANYSRY